MKRVAHIYKYLSLSFTSIKMKCAINVTWKYLTWRYMYSGHILPREQRGIFIVPYLPWHAPSVFAVGDFCDKQHLHRCIVWMSHGSKSAYLPASSWRERVFWSWFASMWIPRWVGVYAVSAVMAEVLKNDV